MVAFIYAYKPGSQSAAALSTSLGIRRIKHRGSRLRGGPAHTIINWGASELPEEVMKCNVINQPNIVAACTNKVDFFTFMDEVGKSELLVPFTTDRGVAEGWIREGKKVVCRTLTRANSGRGIILAEGMDQLVDAPLYTQYVNKMQEYRIHFSKGRATGEPVIFHMQRKARRLDTPDDQVNWQIRNYDNGFIFSIIERGQLPNDVINKGREIFHQTGLDFGAVDIIYNEAQGRAYVLEVNTAPGLEGTTLQRYSDRLLPLIT